MQHLQLIKKWQKNSLFLAQTSQRGTNCLYEAVRTWMSTPGWLSLYVVNVWVCLVGIVVLRLINAVMTPPAVSIPRDSGVTSSSSRSCTSSDYKQT